MAEQAQILEMVGDLKDADEVPPENVLFVCKLNPVTTDEDLEIIFSRFGKINNCEVSLSASRDSVNSSYISFSRSSETVEVETPFNTHSSNLTTRKAVSKHSSKWTTCSSMIDEFMLISHNLCHKIININPVSYKSNKNNIF